MSIKLDSKQQEEIFRILESQGISDGLLGKIAGEISISSLQTGIRTTLAIGEEMIWF
ncbi:hypothetical protein ACIQXG_22705 [Lysinibacillus sphaericus]|uniref:hypothetical protein n=1 Tax=Lysinibacillus sphaericus TaxID=1421 RepID=UPI003810AF01